MTAETRSTHTEGPWKYDDYSHTYHESRVIRKNGVLIAYVCENKGSQFDGLRPNPEVTLANARLIAAAPALLAALEAMYDERDMMYFTEAHALARTAIAQARGSAA